MSLINRKIIAPKTFRANSIVNFINECQDIYYLHNKNEKGFLLDLNKTTKCSMIGVLLVYKVIEFSIKNNCFTAPMYLMGVPFQKAMEKYGFTKLIITYLSDQNVAEKEFKNLKISVTDQFIIAPQALLRNDRYSTEILNRKYLPQIEKYYKSSNKAISMIFLCFSEILLNFWEHAVDDTQSIIVANGNKDSIEIACADNGRGILTTLTQSGKAKNNSIETLRSAVEKGVTSKELTNHMGYGLWIIDEIVSRTKGRFHIYSEGTYYQNEFKKTQSGKCGYWQGTVIYISLPLKNPVTLYDIEPSEKGIGNELKINWS
jgi:anti-sigma regulatory factor (Ser/Thr protein kinase)